MRPLPAPASDIALLVGRVVVGVVLLAHGLQKIGNGVAGVTGAFGGMGVPLPAVSAVFAIVVETLGGILLIAGAATTVVGLAVLVNMLGAFLFVHVSNGVFVDAGGWELVGVIGAAGLVLAAVGPGRFSVDGLLAARRAIPAGVGAHS